jgi:Asp-tRNA(Asn)/Glu-tRNA(Gln) amidotransferase A subunit family amidase
LEWTGDPRFISPWTAIGGPIVSMPAGKAANGLPLGVSLCGKPGADRAMCAWARTIAAAAERHE